MSKSVDVKYHFANTILYGKKESIITVVDDEKGVVKISGSMIKSDANYDILLRFSPQYIKTIFTSEIRDNLVLDLDIDIYSGIVVLVQCDHTYSPHSIPTLYHVPNERSGYIMESPPRMTLIFFKKLAYIEHFQQGAIKFCISSFDTNGYTKYLFPEAILDIIQTVEPLYCPFMETFTTEEVREEKNELSALITEVATPEITPQIHALSLENVVEIVGANHAEDVSLHT